MSNVSKTEALSMVEGSTANYALLEGSWTVKNHKPLVRISKARARELIENFFEEDVEEAEMYVQSDKIGEYVWSPFMPEW